MLHIDINCDMGEEVGNEQLLMPFISSANIACGFHAGNETEMAKMVKLCLQYDVAIGAHPSFPDRENFGRTAMHFPNEKIQQLISEQLQIFNQIVVAAGAKMNHVKLHGALYNMAAKDPVLANAVAQAVQDFDSGLLYYGFANSVMTEAAARLGLRVANEVFADRTYQPDGSLTPRSQTNALIADTDEAIRQVMQMIVAKTVTASNGKNISIQADTVCIHGDGEHAVDFAKKISASLIDAGIRLKSL